MKAAWADQRMLLNLQRIDSEIDRVVFHLRDLPESKTVAAAQAALQQAEDEKVRVETLLSDQLRHLRKCESDVQNVRLRAAKDADLLASGRLAAKQLQELQHEISSLAKRQEALEDVELEAMEAVETAEAEVATAQAHYQEALERVHAAKTGLAEAQEALVTAGEKAKEERIQTIAMLPEALVEHYHQMRSERGGGAVVGLFRYGRCEVCAMELATAELSEVRSADPDDLIYCPQCQAIMVRTEESGL